MPQSSDVQTLDALGRTPLADGMKRQIESAFSIVPEGKRGALIVIADEQSARLHVAAKLGEHWKVAAGLGVPYTGQAPSGWIGVLGAW